MKHKCVRQSKLIGLLAEMGIKHGELADALGITGHSMGQKLNGQYPFWYDEVIAICKLLNIDNPRDYFAV